MPVVNGKHILPITNSPASIITTPLPDCSTLYREILGSLIIHDEPPLAEKIYAFLREFLRFAVLATQVICMGRVLLWVVGLCVDALMGGDTQIMSLDPVTAVHLVVIALMLQCMEVFYWCVDGIAEGREMVRLLFEKDIRRGGGT